PSSNFQSFRIASGKPCVLPEYNDFYLGKILSGKANGIVGRPIINQDNFVISIGLTRKSAQAIFEKSLTIPVHNDNADLIALFSSRLLKRTHMLRYNRLAPTY